MALTLEQFNEAVTNHGPRLLKLCKYTWHMDEAQAQDCVQQVFEDAWRSRALFDEVRGRDGSKNKVVAWLDGIARNKCRLMARAFTRDLRKKEAWVKEAWVKEAWVKEAWVKEATVQELGATTSPILEGEELRHLPRCLEALPSKKGLIMALFYGLELVGDSAEILTLLRDLHARLQVAPGTTEVPGELAVPINSGATTPVYGPTRCTDAEIAELLRRTSDNPHTKGAVTMTRLRALADLKRCIESKALKEGGLPVRDQKSMARGDGASGSLHASERQLLQLFSGSSAPELDSIAHHVSQCRECQVFLDGLEAIENSLHDLAWDRTSQGDDQDEDETLPEVLRQSLLAIPFAQDTPWSLELGAPRASLTLVSPENSVPAVGSHNDLSSILPTPQITGVQKSGFTSSWHAWALAATVLLSVGVWQLARFSQTPRDSGATVPSLEPGWKGTQGEMIRPRGPLQVVIQPGKVTAQHGSDSSPPSGSELAEPKVLNPIHQPDGLWRIPVPSGVPLQLYVLKPTEAMNWNAQVSCSLPGNITLPLSAEGRPLWLGAGDSTDAELAVGSPIDVAILGLKVGDRITCKVLRGVGLETVEIILTHEDSGTK